MNSPLEPRIAGVSAPASDAWVDAAARSRARTRRLQQAAAADATLTGLLVDLGERRTSVVVATSSGRSLEGVIVLVGIDVVGLETAGHETALVPHHAVVTVTTTRSLSPSGPRPPARPVSFAALASDLGAARAIVEIGYGRHRMRGRLVWCGSDVLAFADAQGRTRHVPLDQVSELLVLASG